jgi:methyl-accepting chemotaxis protein
MTIKNTVSKLNSPSWMIFIRVALTVVFLIWIYFIGSSTSDLNEKLTIASSQYEAVDDLQIEFKNEIQAWKDLLLRSTSNDSLEEKWHDYESQFQKVDADAQRIIQEIDVPDVSGRIQSFVNAHRMNRDQYKKSLELLKKDGFNPHNADSYVRGIDIPLFDNLEAADKILQIRKKDINEHLATSTKRKIDQSILGLFFLVLLVIWMPRL